MLALLTKELLNSGRMRLTHIRFRSSGPQISSSSFAGASDAGGCCTSAPESGYAVQTAVSLGGVPSVRQDFLGNKQNTYLPINLHFVVFTVWPTSLAYSELSLECIETTLHKFSFAALFGYNVQQNMQDYL